MTWLPEGKTRGTSGNRGKIVESKISCVEDGIVEVGSGIGCGLFCFL